MILNLFIRAENVTIQDEKINWTKKKFREILVLNSSVEPLLVYLTIQVMIFFIKDLRNQFLYELFQKVFLSNFKEKI
jgi:hypothetical protein